MKEKIGRLSRGIVDLESPVLVTEPAAIEAVIPYGTVTRGDFRVRSGNQLAFRGLIYSSDPHVTAGVGYFTGINSRIAYSVDPARLEAGEVIEGSFKLISNGGETAVPYRFTIEMTADAVTRQASTLAGFAALADKDPAAALAFFGSQDFLKLPFMQEPGARALYDGLSRGESQEQALEEFLIGTHAKAPVRIALPEASAEYIGSPEKAEPLIITRSGRGYITCHAACTAPFIRLITEELTDADFTGNTAQIRYAVNPALLEPGDNIGEIVIETARDRLTAKISVSMPDKGAEARLQEQLTDKYADAYYDLMTGYGTKSSALASMREALLGFGQDEPDFRSMVIKAEYSQLSGDYETAGEILSGIAETAESVRKTDFESYVYYMYLCYMQDKDWAQKEKLLKLISDYLGGGVLNDSVFMIQLRADESLSDMPGQTLSRLGEFYRAGLRSRFMFYETCRIYRRIPDLLKSLGEFEKAVLSFGAGRDYLTPELKTRVCDLAEAEEEYDASLTELLTLMYESEPDPRMLEIICRQLTAGHVTDEGAFAWYTRGVEGGLDPEPLYALYFESMPDDYYEEMPREIYLYYAYNGPEDDRARRLLYSSVVTNFTKDSDIYESYDEQILAYAAAEMLAGHIDPQLAVIYTAVLDRINIEERMARILPDLLLTYYIDCGSSRFNGLAVIYEQMLGEQTVSLKDGSVCLPLYTDRYHLLFIDEDGNRYADIPCTKRRLLKGTEELLEECTALVPGQPMLQLAEAERYLRLRTLDRSQMEFLKGLSEAAGLHPLFKSRLLSVILQQGQWDRSDRNSDMLGGFSESREIADIDRPRLIRGLAAQGYYDDAWNQVRRYGYRMLDRDVLQRLVSMSVQSRNYERDEYLLQPAWELYRSGDADEPVIKYLCMHYTGLSSELYGLLKTAAQSHIESDGLAERLLAQMLFADVEEGIDEVFRLYVRRGTSDRILVNAYLTAKCDQCFLGDDPMSKDVENVIREHVSRELLTGSVPVIWQLALLKAFSGQESFTDEERSLCREMVGRMSQRNIILPYFKKFSSFIDIPEEIRDKTMISYRGHEGDAVALIIPDRTADGREEFLEMSYVYAGIFTRSVLLFEGEEIPYRIQVTRDGQTMTAEEGVLRADITSAAEGSRFRRLNDLKQTGRDASDADWQESMRQFALTDTLNEDLFRLM